MGTSAPRQGKVNPRPSWRGNKNELAGACPPANLLSFKARRIGLSSFAVNILASN